MPLHCYAEVKESLKDIIHYSHHYKSSFSYEDITKLQNNKYFEVSKNNFEGQNILDICETQNYLTEEQNIIDNFNDYYDLDNETFYEKRMCTSIDNISQEVNTCISNLCLSLSWFNEEMEKLYSKEATKTDCEKKRLGKILKQLEQYRNVENKYLAFWNKSAVDLIHLYNKYYNQNLKESVIHSLIVLSLLIKKQDLKTLMNELINQFYKENLDTLNFNVLKTLFACSLTVKSLIIHNVGNVREFVIEKIINNNNLNIMFFSHNDSNP